MINLQKWLQRFYVAWEITQVRFIEEWDFAVLQTNLLASDKSVSQVMVAAMTSEELHKRQKITSQEQEQKNNRQEIAAQVVADWLMGPCCSTRGTLD